MTSSTFKQVAPIRFGKVAGGTDETPMILKNSKAGLYSYQFPDLHVVGSNTTPDQFDSTAVCVGIPGVVVVA